MAIAGKCLMVATERSDTINLKCQNSPPLALVRPDDAKDKLDEKLENIRILGMHGIRV